MPVPPQHEIARRQLAAIALVRADLEGRDDDAILLANTGDPVTLAACAHMFALVLRQTSPDPHALLDALTRIYAADLAHTTTEETP